MNGDFELTRHILDDQAEWTCALQSPLEMIEFPRCRQCGQRCRSALVLYERVDGSLSGSALGRVISCTACSATILLNDAGDTIFEGELRVR